MVNQEDIGEKMLRIRSVVEKIGLSKASIYRYMRKGTFPKPIKVGERIVCWKEKEIDNWLKQKNRVSYPVEN